MVTKKFEPIIVKLPQKEIYSRLGYVKGKTQLSDKQQKQLDDYIQEAECLIDLKGIAVEVAVNSINEQEIVLADDIFLKSRLLAKMLLSSNKVLFMGATAGSAIMDAIQKGTSDSGDMTQAVVFDGVASEMTDAALDWIVNFYNSTLRRENKSLTKRRFSAGYGDFGLENQKVIFDILKLNELGIEITDSFLLVPEKSVTAIAGIEQIDNI